MLHGAALGFLRQSAAVRRLILQSLPLRRRVSVLLLIQLVLRLGAWLHGDRIVHQVGLLTIASCWDQVEAGGIAARRRLHLGRHAASLSMSVRPASLAARR